MTYDYISDCKRREKKTNIKFAYQKYCKTLSSRWSFALSLFYRFARMVAFVNQVSSARFKQPHIATS